MPTVVIDEKNVQEIQYNDDESIESFNLKKLIYTCCVYFCAWMIFIGIVTTVMTVGYFIT